MTSLTWKTEKRKINALIPYDKNPRRLTEEQAAQLTRSLEKFNLVEIPAVNTDGVIIAGHQRLAIMKALGRGAEVVDVRVPSRKLTEAELKEYNIRSNFNTGEWNFEMLTANFDQDMLKDVGFDLSSFPEPEVGAVDGQDDVPEMRKTKIKVGDMFALGEHRLLCGDSTRAEDVAILMGGKKADMIFTDPPYGIGFEYKSHDDKSNKENAELVSKVFSLIKCGKVWTCGLNNLARDISRFGKTYVAVWYKKFALAGSGIGGASIWEPILILDPKAKKLKNNVFEIMTDREPGLLEKHGCPKPVKLFEDLLLALSVKKDLIYEPFGGSGTTLIACEKTGRKCRMIEIEPSYCQVIIDRWEEFTGHKAKPILDK